MSAKLLIGNRKRIRTHGRITVCLYPICNTDFGVGLMGFEADFKRQLKDLSRHRQHSKRT